MNFSKNLEFLTESDRDNNPENDIRRVEVYISDTDDDVVELPLSLSMGLKFLGSESGIRTEFEDVAEDLEMPFQCARDILRIAQL